MRRGIRVQSCSTGPRRMYKMNETVLSVVYCSVNMKTMDRRFGLAKGRAKESHRRESHACKQCNLDLRSTPRSRVTRNTYGAAARMHLWHGCNRAISSSSLSIDPRVTGFTSTLLETPPCCRAWRISRATGPHAVANMQRQQGLRLATHMWPVATQQIGACMASAKPGSSIGRHRRSALQRTPVRRRYG